MARLTRVAALALAAYLLGWLLIPKPFRFEDARHHGRRSPPKTMVQLPVALSAQQTFGPPEARRIPLVIHQSAESRLVHRDVAAASRCWRDAAERGFFDYRFHDAAAQRAFVRARGGEKLLAAFEAAATFARRTRLWRALLLYEEGGLYASMDARLDAPATLWLLVVTRPGDAAILGCARAGRPWRGLSRCRFDDGVLAFAPGHPILALYLGAVASPKARGAGARALSDAAARAGFRPGCDGTLAASGDGDWNARFLAGALGGGGGAAPADDDADDDAARAPPRWFPPISPAEHRTSWANLTCLWRAH